MAVEDVTGAADEDTGVGTGGALFPSAAASLIVGAGAGSVVRIAASARCASLVMKILTPAVTANAARQPETTRNVSRATEGCEVVGNSGASGGLAVSSWPIQARAS